MMKTTVLALALIASLFSGAALAATNVNTADADDLTALTGIGPAKAHAIIEERTDHGDYKSLDGLTRVSGIGNKTVDGLRAEAAVSAEE